MLTGVYQYVSMSLAKTYTAVAKATRLPLLNGVAEVVMFFNIAAFGLALAWLATVWATALLAAGGSGTPRWWPSSPILIFQMFTNFDALATALALGGLLAWARRRPTLAGVLIGLGWPPSSIRRCCCCRCWCWGAHWQTRRGGADGGSCRHHVAGHQPSGADALPAWLVGVLSAQQPPNPGHGLALQRHPVLHRLAGFDPGLGFWQPPLVLNGVVAALFLVCCLAIAYVALTAPTRPRVAQLAFQPVAAFLLVNRVWSPQFSLWLVPLAVLALPHRRVLLAWMSIDALVWVPRMMYLYGEHNKGLPEQWFTATVLLRDLAVVGLVILVIRQIYRPAQDLVRDRGRVDDPGGGRLTAPRTPFRRGGATVAAPESSGGWDAGGHRVVPAGHRTWMRWDRTRCFSGCRARGGVRGPPPGRGAHRQRHARFDL